MSAYRRRASREDEQSYTLTVERVVWVREDGGSAIVRCQDADGKTLGVLGPVSHLRPGDLAEVRGVFVNNPRWGEQIQASSATVSVPQTARGLAKWFRSIDGIGPTLADRIVEALGGGAVDLILADPGILAGIKGLTGDKPAAVAEAVRARHAEAVVVPQLLALAVPPGLVAPILKLLGDTALDVLRSDPYSLIPRVSRLGFKTADSIAAAAGLPQTAPQRIQAGLAYVLDDAAERGGHSYLPVEELLAGAARLLTLSTEAISGQLPLAEQSRLLVVEALLSGPIAYPPRLHAAERVVAERLARILATPADVDAVEVRSPPSLVDPLTGVTAELAPQQLDAVGRSLAAKVSVITGGPGTGKSASTWSIVDAARRAGMDVVLCSPTGRAAKRLAAATGHRASTIHRALEYTPGEEHPWRRNRLNPLDADLVVVDEVSMVDVVLASRLLEAIPDAARLVLVGDVDQLPSVGPGAFLRETIESGAVAVSELSTIYRQAKGSGITRAAHRVNHGLAPEWPTDKTAPSDLYLIRSHEPDAVCRVVLEVVAERLPKKLGVDPFRDVWVLSPQHKGACGVESLNRELREKLNPSGKRRPWGKEDLFRQGDRVMVRRNNYRLGVFNGDAGVVVGFDVNRKEILVEIDDATVRFGSADAFDLDLAYASTIHKAQGQEVPWVVVIMHKSHSYMLNRMLLYTGMTRAKVGLVVVGQEDAVRLAISRAEAGRRYSGLARRVREMLAGATDENVAGVEAMAVDRAIAARSRVLAERDSSPSSTA